MTLDRRRIEQRVGDTGGKPEQGEQRGERQGKFTQD
ncbi:hypothetical protein SDC9_146140 [bioreactor metagenome]|uniref:Uncharacterized protein n=1 Tax=bioreactor metagenome TaxID=1076179 RepID=A0A645EAV4_9ZZZZ